jgi:hypothetical protein
MGMRILLAGALQENARIAAESKVVGIERLLARQDERGRQSARRERMRDGRQLDRFGPGPDDQPDVGEQPSP